MAASPSGVARESPPKLTSGGGFPHRGGGQPIRVARGPIREELRLEQDSRIPDSRGYEIVLSGRYSAGIYCGDRVRGIFSTRVFALDRIEDRTEAGPPDRPAQRLA